MEMLHILHKKDLTHGADHSDRIIKLRHLTKIFGKGDTSVKAVDNFSLHVLKGEVLVIMGPSGAGKTTLVQLIGGLLSPTFGEVLIQETPIFNLGKAELSKFRLNTFGFIFQKPNLLSSLNALQNVEIALNLKGIHGKKAANTARSILTAMGLGHRLNHKPNSLSGGEQQRIAIARALANDPSVLIADEPTANLDSKNGMSIVEILRNIATKNKKTVIIVTHDERIKAYADRILWLEDGHLSLRWIDKESRFDPVCLMRQPQQNSYIVSQFNGTDYTFCSTECRNDFETGPESYLSGV